MPRANRYLLPGYVYHLTHRCHNRDFLLKFARDRDAYRKKLRQALLQHEVSLLDYCVTSNHVHLLAYADQVSEISELMQKVAGEFAQSFNRRKGRSGAYWADRFHSTIVEPGRHLEACLSYIALNMVRCGVVSHPREWSWCGYHELVGKRQRFRILDIERLLFLLGHLDRNQFKSHYEARINEKIAEKRMEREAEWTDSIAVGSAAFVEVVKRNVRGRLDLRIEQAGESWILKEAPTMYGSSRRPPRSGLIC